MPKDKDKDDKLKLVDFNRTASDEGMIEVRKNHANCLELMKYTAQLHWAKYEELLKQGFTAEQALFLCKDLWG